MAHTNPLSTEVIERLRRQAIMNQLSSELSKQKSLYKRRVFSSIKINKRKREVEEASAESPPSKRPRKREDLEEGEILEDEQPTTQAPPHPLSIPTCFIPTSSVASNKENCEPNRPVHVPAIAALPVLSMTDVLRIIHPCYLLPSSMVISGIPEDPEGRARYSHQLQAYCSELRRTLFKDEAKLEAELNILRSIGTLINSKTIPHLPTRIEEALGHISEGILEEEALPTLRRKLAMVLLCIVNLNKVRTAENPVVLGSIQ